MQAISRNQPSHRSKNNPDIELPKIAKQASSSSLNHQLKYEWLGRSSQYALLSTSDIHQQHEYLVGQLASLQEELKKYSGITSRVSTKPLRRSNQTNQAQNREREIENNNFIIIKLRNQLELLSRQANPHSKEGLEAKVHETKEKIAKAKLKIKEIKQKSRSLCDNLENGVDYFEEAKKLEQQRNGICSRKIKLEEKVLLSESNLAKLIQKMADIQEDALYAENFLEDWQQTRKNEVLQKNLQGQYKNKHYQTEIIKKTTQSQKSTKQQKYHQLLKNLQVQMTKVELTDQKMQKTQIKHLYQMKELIQLEEKASQLDLNRSRSKTSGSIQPFRGERPHQLPVIQKKFNPIAIKKRNLSTSRSKTTTYNDSKQNFTEILSKPPSSQSDISSMMSQPAKGYFRSSKRISGRNSRTAVAAEKSSQITFHNIQEQIVEQSPEKETIQKNVSQIKEKQGYLKNGEVEKEEKEDTVMPILIEPSEQNIPSPKVQKEDAPGNLPEEEKQQRKELLLETHENKEKVEEQQRVIQEDDNIEKESPQEEQLQKQKQQESAPTPETDNQPEPLKQTIVESQDKRQPEKDPKQTKLQQKKNIIENYLNNMQQSQQQF